MKKVLSSLFVALLVLTLCTSCGKKEKGISIAVPNDTTNEARALMLLENLDLIKLKDGAGITATVNDIEDNPYNIKIEEVEASQIPSFRQDVSFAVINSNYAIDAGLNPAEDALELEGSFSAYANILAVKQGREEEPVIKALKAALESKEVADFINSTYAGSVLSTVDNPTDGYDASVDYESLKGSKVVVGATPTPHGEILEIVKKILEEKGIELEIVIYTDYVAPNISTEDGGLDANYFQHVPYMDDFNSENGTHMVSISAVHVEPMGIYPGQLQALEDIK